MILHDSLLVKKGEEGGTSLPTCNFIAVIFEIPLQINGQITSFKANFKSQIISETSFLVPLCSSLIFLCFCIYLHVNLVLIKSISLKCLFIYLAALGLN